MLSNWLTVGVSSRCILAAHDHASVAGVGVDEDQNVELRPKGPSDKLAHSALMVAR